MMYLVTKEASLFKQSPLYDICSIDKLLDYFKDKDLIGLDTETEGFDPYTKRILLCQLGDEENQFAVDSTIDIVELKELLEDSSKLFILQNASFDLRFFLHKRIIIKKVFDTYLAEKLLWLGYPAQFHKMGLDNLCEEYLGVKLDKTVRGSIHIEGVSDRVIVYGCNDVKYLIPLYKAQLEKLRENDLVTAVNIENSFVLCKAYAEYCGIKLDVEAWDKKCKEDRQNLEEAKTALDNWIIENGPSKYVRKDVQQDLFGGIDRRVTINWASSKQVVVLLKELGFNLKTVDKATGAIKDSVESTIIAPQKHISSITTPYLKYKEYEILVNTFGEKFKTSINKISGRIHTQFNQLMDTTRLSSGGIDKDTKQKNINFQNIPADEYTRKCFIADEGHLLVDCDYKAQEDYIFAELSRESKLLEFYNDSKERDGHSFVAKLIYNEELKDIDELDVKAIRPDLRSISKRGKFAIHYGGDGSVVAKNLGIPIEKGLEFERKYYKAFPGIKAYFDKVDNISWSRGYILISPLTRHKAYIYDHKDLVSAYRKMDSNFWDMYRKYKSISTQTKDSDPNLFWKEFPREVRDPIVGEAFRLFARGEDIDSISETPLVYRRKGSEKSSIVVKMPKGVLVKEIASHYFRRRKTSRKHALNYPVQGTGAQMSKLACIAYYKHLLKDGLLFKCKLINLVHDEILIEVPSELAESEAKCLKDCMEGAASLFCTAVKLTAEPCITKFWRH